MQETEKTCGNCIHLDNKDYECESEEFVCNCSGSRYLFMDLDLTAPGCPYHMLDPNP